MYNVCMPQIQFNTNLITVHDWLILHLPEEASAKLPSRGMTMVKGTVNDVPFKAVLEPDGRYLHERKPSHWFSPDKELIKKAGLKNGSEVTVSLEVTTEWIDPEVPDDMQEALDSSVKAKALWNDITPMARWDWVRWVRAVKTEETRKNHLEVMLDKLNKGMRRPCCFNRAACSEPHVANSKWALDIK